MKINKLTLGVLWSAFFALVVYFLFFYLPDAFSSKSTIDPYAFTIFSFKIRWYGILIALGIFTSVLISQKELLRAAIKTSVSDGLFLYTIIFGIIGARIGFVVQNTQYYANHWPQIFALWDGGLSIHGAIIMGALGLFIACRIYRQNFIKVANVIAPTIFIAGAIGRFGNFFNQEIIGQPSQIFWKMYVLKANRPVGYEQFDFFHPVFLYESLSFIVLYLIYVFLNRKYKSMPGFAYTIIFYSLARVIVEFWRIDYRPILGPFDLAQLVSFGIIIIGLVIGFVTLTKGKK